ncbi:MAG TPA: carboxypeptidase-like regulatory domain-containing protein, partial [bacterium]|nr:carboxypeptidase-like regulatory domain-containing protein [bacterium]
MKRLLNSVRGFYPSFMNRSPIRFSGWVLLLIGVVVLSAAPSAVFGGTIKGTIFDKDTKDPLPAGNIMLKGTSLGTAANFKGAYTIADVPAGKYTIVVSIIGYEKLSAEVEIPAEGVVEHNFSLKSVTLQGQQVTITAQAQGQLQAINQQIASARITNVVSKSRIQELPDDNAATALSRLPGLSLQDGDKVVIRGIQAKLNTVLINGIQVPSTELNDRSTNLGFISSNLL